MKKSTLILSVVITFLFSACSNARYGHLTRTVKVKKNKTEEKTQLAKTENAIESIAPMKAETEVIPSIPKSMTVVVASDEKQPVNQPLAIKKTIQEKIKIGVSPNRIADPKLKQLKTQVDNTLSKNKKVKRVADRMQQKIAKSKASPDGAGHLLRDILVIVLVLILISVLLSLLPQPLSYALSVIITVLLILYLLDILL